MRYWLILGLLCFTNMAFSQQMFDEKITMLIEKYKASPELKCEIKIEIEVEGMEIPDKTILVDFEEGKKPKIKGEGLTLLPKKGMINQFNELFSTSMQAIQMAKNEERFSYKLVSLDEKSNWVTADIIFDADALLIYESVINTRKQGAFKAVHTYENLEYPSKSIITFEAKKFKVPLRFIGRQDKLSDFPNKDEVVLGKVILDYRYLN